MAFQVEKNVPIPPKSHRKTSGVRSALRSLSVNESIFVDGKDAKKFRAQAHQVLGKGKYTTRSDDAGVRIWRLA